MKLPIKRRTRDLKLVVIMSILLMTISWVARGGGKYDHVRWQLAGFESQQFTVGDHDEQIKVRLNTAGRNWALDFDEDEEVILVKQDDEVLLGGWFVPEEGFAQWEEDFLNTEEYTILETDAAEDPAFYFCRSNEGWYAFLTKIDSSEQSAVFFTDDAEITQEQALKTYQRLTIKHVDQQ